MDVQRRIATLAGTLSGVALGLEVYAIINALGGVIAGIAIAAHSETDAYATPPVTHPWIGQGIGVIAAALVFGAIFWCFARALRIYAVDMWHRHGGHEPLPPRYAPPVSAESRRSRPVQVATKSAVPAPDAPMHDALEDLFPGMRVRHTTWTAFIATVDSVDPEDTDFVFVRDNATGVQRRFLRSFLEPIRDGA